MSTMGQQPLNPAETLNNGHLRLPASQGTRTGREGGCSIGSDQTVSDRLWALARNLWWTWHPEVVSLFRDLDPIRWRQLAHNPIALLSEFPLERLEQRVDELVLRSPINCAYRWLQEYLHAEETWGAAHAGVLQVRPVAYFSAEFGLHESLPIYSGGLGVLAEDHIKSASDLDVPLVGVGLFYRQGYFRQWLDQEGRQREESLTVNVAQLPLGPDGKPVAVKIETRGRQHRGPDLVPAGRPLHPVAARFRLPRGAVVRPQQLFGSTNLPVRPIRSRSLTLGCWPRVENGGPGQLP